MHTHTYGTHARAYTHTHTPYLLSPFLSLPLCVCMRPTEKKRKNGKERYHIWVKLSLVLRLELELTPCQVWSVFRPIADILLVHHCAVAWRAGPIGGDVVPGGCTLCQGVDVGELKGVEGVIVLVVFFQVHCVKVWGWVSWKGLWWRWWYSFRCT